jgi:deoxyribodipyrimidine photo-lyase
MNKALYWFRNDLRLADNPALTDACAAADQLGYLYVVPAAERAPTRWGFERAAPHRRAFRDQALDGLRTALAQRDRELLVTTGVPAEVIAATARASGVRTVFCEAIAAPEELHEVDWLRAAGLDVRVRFQSSLVAPEALPFPTECLPGVFTTFRQAVEDARVPVGLPLPVPRSLPAPLPPVAVAAAPRETLPPIPDGASFPFGAVEFNGAEQAAHAHLRRYFDSQAPRHYKESRNELAGIGFSTKFSPWLATGALSARSVHAALAAHEARLGGNDSTYWIWFELLWRDFFRFSSLQNGARLFRAAGLSRLPPPHHDPAAFSRWCAGQTGHSFIDAGMRELAATGFLSNRMRQIVASYLVHDLACDWRAGAAWFESRLIDYDVCSNQGNWAYIAGRGADPRQGRRFNTDKQAASYDPEGRYREKWARGA